MVIGHALGTSLGLLGAAFALFLLQLVHLALVLAWCERRGRGLSYFGLSRPERRRFKTILRWHKAILAPTIWILSRVVRFQFAGASLSFQGMSAPKGSCSKESIRRAMQYAPQRNDVFVVTQMRSGTTWMQHLIYQILTRGGGDLSGQGKTLYAVSPWLESFKSVSIDEAPLIGKERPSRIVKTHLPASLCPFSKDAKYVYVVRDPVSCFSSCFDFICSDSGAFRPTLEACEEWFTSDDLMWWSTWPTHVSQWLHQAERNSNILVVRFEDMKRDLSQVADEARRFLGVEPLSPLELSRVLQRCAFGYMRDNADAFEMTPPHVLQGQRGFLVSGKADRYRDVPEDVRERISKWCRGQLASANTPMASCEGYFRDP